MPIQSSNLPKKQRLHKVIAKWSDLSRRKAEEAILMGRIAVNGKPVEKLGLLVDPDTDRITIDRLILKPIRRHWYVAYYKPRNRIVSQTDPQGRKTIWDDIPKWKGRLKSAGRLDFDSEGLLLLSNDGDFINTITHPKFECEKRYHVKVTGVPTKEELAKFEKEVTDGADTFRPAKVFQIKQEGHHSWLEIRLHEGKYHQVKRMCASINHPVLKLKRISVGPVRLGQLKRGKSRTLTKRELVEFGIL